MVLVNPFLLNFHSYFLYRHFAIEVKSFGKSGPHNPSIYWVAAKLSIAHFHFTVHPPALGQNVSKYGPMLAFVERIGYRTYKHTTPLLNAPGNP